MTTTPDEPGPDLEPGDIPLGPQETNPDADDEPDVPSETQPGQMPDHDTEVGA
jgi:hypothetical protein